VGRREEGTPKAPLVVGAGVRDEEKDDMEGRKGSRDRGSSRREVGVRMSWV
jgi:hypothetical protein